ncbi:hypothetical protein HED60_06015 [Planctomycetales bacterium ZRK34]|nr:hypothetical protein HED60_06015 [Planctomycetales bacterium ZRK34]
MDKTPPKGSNVVAARAATETTRSDDASSADLETAWSEWSKRIKKADARARTLLRTAFEAGWEAGKDSAGAHLGKLGGLKGGKARAKKLSAERRSKIARKAAAARWADEDDQH